LEIKEVRQFAPVTFFQSKRLSLDIEMGSVMTALKRLFFLLLLLNGSFLMARSGWAANETSSSMPETYRLHLHHLHTGEDINVVYRVGDRYLPEGVSQLDHFLRDHRTGDSKDYDVREFDLLHDLMIKVGRPEGTINIVCGYRTPWSNNYLRQHGHGVALHSQHMEAKAIDIRVPGVKSAEVRDAALAMQRGGVGYYASSDFVHVDVGRVRRW
jgi:uncharacterized protein YcbK (DUF882 family)